MATEYKLPTVTVRDVAPADFITSYAAHLKRAGNLELPKWVDYAKTANFKELAPYDPDWYYVRVASVARKVYLRAGNGVGQLRTAYGGRKNNGFKPSHFAKGSGSVIRAAMASLEKLGVVEHNPAGGRRVTQKGRAEMDTQAALLAQKE
eukprot:CAMPEP_0174892698 /NCGR_PEP_ID=MMETSP0167-20121228/7617_1 /TAXON_ID=38298 /ORGANISM="Rhodella maculata, Strain CCMP736" /LENGTH=148 /DNA_ID=CAMNT_0016131279 /DNA_START=84 /DNA_END=530 /DNA_ORIENTATION=-